MILARLTRAIRQQNWFAVVLEFVIVILGVVIGFQITAWNAERESVTREAAILVRLRDGLVGDRQARARSANNLDRLEGIRYAVGVLFEDLPIENEASFCSAIVTSDYYSDSSAAPPALTEMINGAEGLDIVSDPELRQAIAAYVQFREGLPRMVDWYVRGSTDLDAEFPDLLTNSARLDPESGAVIPETRCDVDRLRAEPALLSAFSENAWRYEYYFQSVVLEQDNRAARLIERLDEAIGRHEEPTP